ncbi:hypothetical protein BJ875DRAFT_381087 [Amylocarpus encephaloides]|uniref:NAD(P)-binding protein n=1 Tax=Amylocarpus encephaloides TaxID=45428 RepID=A0A9P7YEA1_9HELO|nr:hypothetical protein BJ875DRAFT_381087 [Amylocarpus encephaloides]
MTFHPDALPDLSGKVYIVTGGNSGVGYNTVLRLAQHGAHVYMCARSSTKAADAIGKITTIYPSAKITHLPIDHCDLSSVVSAANLFLSKEQVLHGLVNNAGIMATPFQLTKDGHEAQWQTNYLAHWVLTSHLLPILLATSKTLPAGSVRLVNLASSGHWSAPKGGINFADTSLESGSTMTRYGQSKLGNVLHAKTINALYGPNSPSAKGETGEIWTAAVHPGLVKSELANGAENTWIFKTAVVIFNIFGLQQSGDVGSFTSLFCAASPDMNAKQSGTYFQQIAEAGWQSGKAKDLMLAERLEEWTKGKMVKEKWIE